MAFYGHILARNSCPGVYEIHNFGRPSLVFITADLCPELEGIILTPKLF